MPSVLGWTAAKQIVVMDLENYSFCPFQCGEKQYTQPLRSWHQSIVFPSTNHKGDWFPSCFVSFKTFFVWFYSNNSLQQHWFSVSLNYFVFTTVFGMHFIPWITSLRTGKKKIIFFRGSSLKELFNFMMIIMSDNVIYSESISLGVFLLQLLNFSSPQLPAQLSTKQTFQCQASEQQLTLVATVAQLLVITTTFKLHHKCFEYL